MAVPEGYTEVGLIGLVNKGNYDPLTEYSKYNFVYYQGSTYLYINELPQSGVTPSDDGVTWQYMSRGMMMDNTPTQGSPNAVTSGGIYDSERALKTEIQNEQTAATTKATDTNNVLGQGTVTNATNVQALLDNVTDKDTNPTKDSAKTVTSGGVYSADKATREMIAPVEENAASSAPYAIGEQLIFNGVLCEATSAISIGDTLAMGTNLSTANKITNRDSTPTANSTKLVTSGGVYSADNQIRENIANVEGATSSHPYAVGKQLIFNGLLCKATSAIAVGDTLAVGTNLALADNVVEQIYSLNQGLTNSLNVLGAKNLLPNNAVSQTMNGITFTVNSDGSVTVNGTASAYTQFDLNSGIEYKEGKYALNGCPSGGGSNTYVIWVRNLAITVGVTDGGNGATLNVTNGDTFKASIVVYSGATVNSLTFYPMLRPASIQDDTYVPYSMTNREMTPYVQSISNPNLLDNPWFTVNQRGQSSYSSGYTVDRWKIGYGDVICNVTNDGITLSSSILGSNLVQVIEEDFYNKFIAGKDLTLSVLLTDGTIKSATGHAPVNTSYYQNAVFVHITNTCTLFVVGKTGENEHVLLRFTEANSNPVSIKAIKLELGTVSTLAMDTAPNYQQELAKCQRYFVRFGSNESVPAYTYNFGMAYEINSSGAYFNVMLPIPMRSTPLISYQGSWAIGSKALNNITVDSMFNNIVKLVCTTSQTFTAGKIELLENKEAGINYIDFTADL